MGKGSDTKETKGPMQRTQSAEVPRLTRAQQVGRRLTVDYDPDSFFSLQNPKGKIASRKFGPSPVPVELADMEDISLGQTEFSRTREEDYEMSLLKGGEVTKPDKADRSLTYRVDNKSEVEMERAAENTRRIPNILGLFTADEVVRAYVASSATSSVAASASQSTFARPFKAIDGSKAATTDVAASHVTASEYLSHISKMPDLFTVPEVAEEDAYSATSSVAASASQSTVATPYKATDESKAAKSDVKASPKIVAGSASTASGKTAQSSVDSVVNIFIPPEDPASAMAPTSVSTPTLAAAAARSAAYKVDYVEDISNPTSPRPTEAAHDRATFVSLVEGISGRSAEATESKSNSGPVTPNPTLESKAGGSWTDRSKNKEAVCCTIS
jgi:hypothetical protein